jgi:hypothetical protein
MGRYKLAICIAFGAGTVAACSNRQPERATASEAIGIDGKKPPKDAAPDSSPPVDAAPDGPPPVDAGVDSAPPPPPGFIDACALPGMVKPAFNPTLTFWEHDEGVTAALDLPFPFTFYGTSYTKYWITTNGQLGFGNTVGGTDFGQATCPLPYALLTRPLVFAYSVDLISRIEPNQGICYATTGTAPNRKHVVTWNDSTFYDAPAPRT